MKVLGLTGNFGSGKSTAAKMFKRFGASIIDADKIAHEVIMPKNHAYKKIISIFGKKVLKKNSNFIDRQKLGKIVFYDSSLLRRLDAIVHPEIISRIKECIKSSRAEFIILDAPLLIEAGLESLVDYLIVVTAGRKEQLSRLKKKTGLSSRRITAIISKQLPLKDKIIKADFVIDNNGTRNNTYKQVKAVWKKINR